MSAKWRTSCRLSKIYGSYNVLLSQRCNQARILIRIVIYGRINKLTIYRKYDELPLLGIDFVVLSESSSANANMHYTG